MDTKFSDIVSTIVATYGVYDTLSVYINKISSAAKAAHSMSSDNNHVGMALQVGIILESVSIIEKILKDTTVKDKIKADDVKLKIT